MTDSAESQSDEILGHSSSDEIMEDPVQPAAPARPIRRGPIDHSHVGKPFAVLAFSWEAIGLFSTLTFACDIQSDRDLNGKAFRLHLRD